MFTIDYLPRIYACLKQEELPEALKQPTFNDVKDALEFYNQDEELTLFVNTFIQKLEAFMQTHGISFSLSDDDRLFTIRKGLIIPTATGVQSQPKQTNEHIFVVKPGITEKDFTKTDKETPKKEKSLFPKPPKTKKHKPKYKVGQYLYWYDNDGTLIKETIKSISEKDNVPIYAVYHGKHTWSYGEPEIDAALAEKRMFLEKPAKQVEKLPLEIVFIKRYLALDGKTKTKHEIVTLIKSLQKAIVEKQIRKTSEYAAEIEEIQHPLLKCHASMGKSIKIAIDHKKYSEYTAIVESCNLHPAVRFIKRYIAILGVEDKKLQQKRAEHLLCLIEKQMPKLENDPAYGKAITNVYNSLEQFLDSGKLQIAEQQLSGLMGLAGISDLGGVGSFLAATASNLLANVLSNQFIKKPTNAVAGMGNTSIDIINSLDFAKMTFETILFTGKWEELIGNPSKKFSMMVYGNPGGGKTTLCISFAKYLAQDHNMKVLFATIEEGVNGTCQEKFSRMDAFHSNITISNYLPGDLNVYAIVFIDSVNTFRLSPETLSELKKNNPNTSFISIFQVTKNGVFKGSKEFEHDMDVVVSVENGIASTIGCKNRFGKSGEMGVY